MIDGLSQTLRFIPCSYRVLQSFLGEFAGFVLLGEGNHSLRGVQARARQTFTECSRMAYPG